MNANNRKITFPDKENAFLYSKNNVKLLDADNINEIKNVVNNLSDDLSNVILFNEIFKYIRFNIPENLEENYKYSAKLELSKTPDFKDVIEIDGTYKLTNDFLPNAPDKFHNFYLFKNNIWNNYGNIIFDSTDINNSFIIDVSNYINNDPIYFGRIKIINLSINEEHKWESCGLAPVNHLNYEINNFSYIEILGKVDLFENEESSYEIKFHNINELFEDTEEIVTNYCKFSITNQNISTINKNILKINSNLENDIYQQLNVSYIKNNKIYETSLNILLKVNKLININILLDQNIIYEGSSLNINVIGSYDNGTNINLNNKIYSIFTTLKNCKINQNNSNITLIGLKGNHDEIGNIFIKYIDNKKNEYKCIKQIIYKNNSLKTFHSSLDIENIFNIEEDKTLEIPISFSIEYKNGNVVDVSNNIDLIEINTSYFDIINEKNYKKLILKKEKHINSPLDILLYINYKNDQDIIEKIYKLTLINNNSIIKLECNIDKEFLWEKESTKFNIKGITNLNKKIDITNISHISICPTLTNIKINKNNIIVDKIDKELTIILEIEYNNLKLYKPIIIKPNILKDIDVRGKILVFPGQYEYKFIVKYSNNDIINVEHLDNFKLFLASGNPNLVSIIKNVATFYEPSNNVENLTLCGEYYDPDFKEEHLFKLINIELHKQDI